MRKYDEKYDFYYEHQGELSDPCIYCGHPATSWDHVPPLHYVSRLVELKLYHDKLLKYPACFECNSALGGAILPEVNERKAHIKQYLMKKYKKWLAMPDWDQDELAELDDASRDYIESQARFAAQVKSRLDW